jgi:predicted outer membrane repeat protein
MAELEQREAHQRALLDSIPAIAWSADGEGNFDYFNRQLLEFTGNNSHEDGGAIHPRTSPGQRPLAGVPRRAAEPTRSSTASAATTASTAG